MNEAHALSAKSHPFLPFHAPAIGDEEVAEVVATLRSGWLTTGARTFELEADFRRLTGAPQAIAVSSGTAALHLPLAAAGIGAGDEVIVPTFTFAASAEAVCYTGAVPVLADVDPHTGNLDACEVARRLGPRTRAVMPVHLGGLPCDVDAIREVAHAHGALVIDDAAHALPARLRGRWVGTLADATAFSFYATKNVTTGEGGMVTTAREDWAERMRVLRLHGISRDAWKRYTAEGTWAYEILELGWKYNLPDVLAAIGVAQLRKVGRFIATRRALAARYRAALAGLDTLELPEEPPGFESAWHLFVVRLAPERLRIDRAAVIEELRQAGIGTSVHFIPLHLHPLYRRLCGDRPGDFPGAEALYRRCVSLPLYPGLAEADVDRVADTLRDVLVRHRR